jgi:N6-L-threonylcarbamoyladenine synthase
MRVLGLETSCDETGIAVVDDSGKIWGEALHSQTAMHERFGGVVPELAARDHTARIVTLVETALRQADCEPGDIDAIAFTQGPGLAGALLVGAAVAAGAAFALGKPLIGIHHLEGHLLSPLLATPRPAFPFVALLVSGGHTQLLRVDGLGRYHLLGDTVDDAAGEAFDKSAKLLGLGYPGGPAIAALAGGGDPRRYALPRPMLHSGDLEFSFSGLKTAVLTQARKASITADSTDAQARADLAAGLQQAIVDVLVAKSLAALQLTGLRALVVAGGVSANQALRARLLAAPGVQVYFPPARLCTDNGAMIAWAGALRLAAQAAGRPAPNASASRSAAYSFSIRPRWPLEELVLP